MNKRFLSLAAGSLCIFLLLFISCSSHSEGASFTSRLDEIDSYISQNSTDMALKELKRLENKAYSSFERLGLYKRYILIGEKDKAEKILVKGLKKLPGNVELSAVYANFLLREGRLAEAFKTSLCLKNSKYSSIYSECVVRTVFFGSQNGTLNLDEIFAPPKNISIFDEKKSSEEIPQINMTEVFSDLRFVDVYSGAFNGSKDSAWIFNAASILMKHGQFDEAALLYPHEISGFRESLFWGSLFFDSGNYSESLDALLSSEKLADFEQTQAQKEYKALILALEADDYYVAGDEDISESVRKKLLEMDDKKYVVPKVFMNSISYAREKGDKERMVGLLDQLVAQYPDYSPAMALYGEVALDDLVVPKEDEYIAELRSAGLKTVAMEKQDRIPTVKFDDAVRKIDFAMGVSGEKNLIVIKDFLMSEKGKLEGKTKQISDVWMLLEANATKENSYPPELVLYSLGTLTEKGYYDDAQALFESYMDSKYSGEDLHDLGKLDLWELEYLAWFSSRNGDFHKGFEIYNFIVDRFGSRLFVLNSQGKNNSIFNAFINLSVLYESTDQLKNALDMLNKAVSMVNDADKKAEVLYRIGKISWNMGDTRTAIRSLKYATTLVPAHNQARLLLKKML
ncbi:MAG: hypothetical protein MSC48_07440 [Spirochaetia bacterium]|nr:hypothetical protein [Spirochaetia bacterium]